MDFPKDDKMVKKRHSPPKHIQSFEGKTPDYFQYRAKNPLFQEKIPLRELA